jgi:hypothetical protein
MRGAEQIIYLKFGKAGIVEVPVGEGGDKTVGWLKEALAAITKVGSVRPLAIKVCCLIDPFKPRGMRTSTL